MNTSLAQLIAKVIANGKEGLLIAGNAVTFNFEGDPGYDVDFQFKTNQQARNFRDGINLMILSLGYMISYTKVD